MEKKEEDLEENLQSKPSIEFNLCKQDVFYGYFSFFSDLVIRGWKPPKNKISGYGCFDELLVDGYVNGENNNQN